MAETFPSLNEFYAADERRRYSGERDFGVWWWDGEPWDSANYRVSVIDVTGELYAVRLDASHGTVRTPDGAVVTYAAAGAEGAVELLGVVGTYGDAERLLEGWADICGRPDSLKWVRHLMKESDSCAATTPSSGTCGSSATPPANAPATSERSSERGTASYSPTSPPTTGSPPT